jgi:hypothetical protein
MITALSIIAVFGIIVFLSGTAFGAFSHTDHQHAQDQPGAIVRGQPRVECSSAAGPAEGRSASDSPS